jgi:hypothetical protein
MQNDQLSNNCFYLPGLKCVMQYPFKSFSQASYKIVKKCVQIIFLFNVLVSKRIGKQVISIKWEGCDLDDSILKELLPQTTLDVFDNTALITSAEPVGFVEDLCTPCEPMTVEPLAASHSSPPCTSSIPYVPWPLPVFPTQSSSLHAFQSTVVSSSPINSITSRNTLPLNQSGLLSANPCQPLIGSVLQHSLSFNQSRLPLTEFSVNNSETLAPDMASSSERKVRTFLCSFNDYETTVINAIERHIAVHETGDAGIVCTSCRLVFKTGKGILKHKCLLPSCIESVDSSEIAESGNHRLHVMEAAFQNSKLCTLAFEMRCQYRLPEAGLDYMFKNIVDVLSDTVTPRNEYLSIASLLSSAYSRDQVMMSGFGLVRPEEVVLSNGQKGYYIPLHKIIQLLLRIPTNREYLLNPHVGNNAHCAWECTWNANRLCQRTPLINFILYYDDLEVCNPLGSGKGKHKLAVFYIQLANIPAKFRSSLSSIYPLAIARTHDLRHSAFHNSSLLLADFMDTINKLHSGLDIIFQGNELPLRMQGRLLFLCGDSLASNFLGGFKEGFHCNVHRCCRTCTGTNEEMRSHHESSHFNERTLVEHRAQLADISAFLSQRDRDEWSKIYGVSGFSVLDSVHNFDITKQMPHDIMHLILLGVFPKEFHLMVSAHIDNHAYTLNDLNGWLLTHYYAIHDSHDRPNRIKQDLRMKQSARQHLTLLKYFPVFAANRIAYEDQYFRNFMRLYQITQISLAPMACRNSAQRLRKIIEQHNSTYIHLYGVNNFIPKLHFLVHLPEQLMAFGPLRQQWCFAFEMRHQIIKNIRWYNFQNLPYSVSNYLCKDLLNRVISCENETFNTYTQTRLQVRSRKSRTLICNGIRYSIGDVVIANNGQFYRLCNIKREEGGMACKAKNLVPLLFDLHTQSYKCQIMSEEVDVNINSLVCPWPAVSFSTDDCYVSVIPTVWFPDCCSSSIANNCKRVEP